MNKNGMLSAIVLLSLLSLVGCAAGGGAKFNVSELEGISDKYAAVFFYRKADIFNILGRDIPILANEVEIGSLYNGEYFKKSMMPGKHMIHSDMRNTIDKISYFQFEAGNFYYVRFDYVNMFNLYYYSYFVIVPEEEALPEITKTVRR